MSRDTQKADGRSAVGRSLEVHSSQGGQQPQRGSAPYGTWVVIAVLVLTILVMWFLVLGILEARA